MDPNQTNQLLAYYKAQFPGQMAMSLGNAPTGTDKGAGTSNGIAKIAMALMQRNAMQKYNQQYPQQTAPAIPQTPVPTPVPQGQTLGGATPMPGQQ